MIENVRPMSVWVGSGATWRYGDYSVTASARGWWVAHRFRALELQPSLEAAKAWTERYAAVVALAQRAQTDLQVARRAFRKLARANGYAGEVGGWIYRNGSERAVAHGWQQLADLVAAGHVRFEVGA